MRASVQEFGRSFGPCSLGACGRGLCGVCGGLAPLSQRAKLVVLLGSLLAPAGIGGFAMRDALTLPALETLVLFGKWLCVAMMVGAAVYAMYVATFDETKQLSKMKLWHTVVFYFATTLFIAALSAAAYFILECIPKERGSTVQTTIRSCSGMPGVRCSH